MEGGRREKAAVTDMRRTLTILGGSEDRGKRPQAKQCGQPLKCGKGKETGSFSGPPERNTALPMPDFSSVRPIYVGILSYRTVGRVLNH